MTTGASETFSRSGINGRAGLFEFSVFFYKQFDCDGGYGQANQYDRQEKDFQHRQNNNKRMAKVPIFFVSLPLVLN